MMPPEDDFVTSALRNALRESADSFDPDGDGLEKIRRQLAVSGPQRRARQMLTWWTRLIWLVRVRVEPVANWARSVAARSARVRSALAGHPWARPAARWWAQARGKWPVAAEWLIARVPEPAVRRWALMSLRRRSPAHASRSAGPARRAARVAWLRSALAVAGAVVIVVAGVNALAQLRQTIEITQFSGAPATPVNSPRPSVASAPAHSARPSPSTAATPSPHRTRHARRRPAPASTCSPSPTEAPTGQPTPSGSPTPTPSPSPTVTASPAPSTTAGSAAAPGSGTARHAPAASGTAAPRTTAPCSRSGPPASAPASAKG